MIIQFFIPHRYSQNFYREVLDWRIICGVFALILGLQSLLHVEWTKIRRKKEGWGFSVVTITAVFVVALIGIIDGVGEGSLFIKIYKNITIPMQATMFSLLGFYMASAAFRAFKARTKEATILLIAALVVMFGRVPIGYFVWHRLPEIVEWILRYPSMAAQRGILLGVGLGMMATSLKIMLGIERGWLGGGK
jgi:hypothetical protein